MTQNDFQSWLEQTSLQPGVLACGVKASQASAVKIADPSFPEVRVKELLQALSEIGLTLRQDHLTGGRWRWLFENGQIHSIRRQDGAFALVILANDSVLTSIADIALAEFSSILASADSPAETLMAGDSHSANGSQSNNGSHHNDIGFFSKTEPTEAEVTDPAAHSE